jgi:hypothetical protein
MADDSRDAAPDATAGPLDEESQRALDAFVAYTEAYARSQERPYAEREVTFERVLRDPGALPGDAVLVRLMATQSTPPRPDNVGMAVNRGVGVRVMVALVEAVTQREDGAFYLRENVLWLVDPRYVPVLPYLEDDHLEREVEGAHGKTAPAWRLALDADPRPLPLLSIALLHPAARGVALLVLTRLVSEPVGRQMLLDLVAVA